MIELGRLRTALVLGAAASLGACSGTVQENLGLGKRSPDEFQVVRRAPLVLPPDYSLRPPAPGAPGPVTQDTAAQAEEILTGQPRVPHRDEAEPGRAGAAVAQAGPGRARHPPDPGQEDPELINLDDSRFLFILNFQRRAMRPSSPT